MVRLIDAQALKEYIAKKLRELEPTLKTEEYKMFARLVAIEFLTDIDEQPIAYDVDKVVEQLKDMTIEELGITDGQFMMDEGEYSSYCALSLADVIETVKGGGV